MVKMAHYQMVNMAHCAADGDVMHWSHRPRARNADGAERGAILVEFALVLPVITLIIFGMLEFGMGFNNKSSLQQGTREGARQASVGDFGGDTSCAVQGASPNTVTHELVCLVKERAELDGDEVRVKIDFVTTNETGNQLAVCTLYPLDSITGFFAPLLSGKTLQGKVETRIESDDDDLQEIAETPPPGGSWSFCS
jgi:Flp pilus assembly protein TadG